MVEILYLAHNRMEFTRASLAAMLANTDFDLVSRVCLYDDASTDGTTQVLRDAAKRIPKAQLVEGKFGSPVAVMNDYLSRMPADRDIVIAKLDNDTMVPPVWLGQALGAMTLDLELLGIEAHYPVVSGVRPRSFKAAPHIGGIGLFRHRAFITLPRPSGLFGFTAWQTKSPWVTCGWIDPALPVFLLDRLPMEPWRSLSKQYVALGWQRDWPPYEAGQSKLWEWWRP